jgi:ribosomal protein S18 acetylase RimI-like enzyme
MRGEEEAHESNATVMGVVRFSRRLTGPEVVLRAGASAVRVRPWPADATTAQVVPVPGAVLPSAQEIVRWLGGLSRLGYAQVRTAALAASDQRPYREAGFDALEELVLLSRPLDGRPARPARKVRRATRADWLLLPEVDAAAFGDAWHLDRTAILDACHATPRHRLRVADESRGSVRPVGYVVNGRAGATGYIQRLAVRPEATSQGWGTALVVDGLRWMVATGCAEALVNTHHDNHRALALYARLGFTPLPDGLTVLGSALGNRA